MVVKSRIKLVKSLQQKKYRNQHGLFVVEGIKSVGELLDSRFKVDGIFTTDVSVLDGFATMDKYKDRIEPVTESELRKMSGLSSPNTVIGTFEIPQASPPQIDDWILALDDVRDPGNLGTIIRLCDWFGIKHLVCSSQTVDCYNPKVLQACMGSIARVQVGYTDLEEFLEKQDALLGQAGLPIFGTFMEGEAIQETELPEKGILVMGNEANGISAGVEALVSRKISIPRPVGPNGKSDHQAAESLNVETTAESLNVAMATAILLHEIRRA